MFLWYDEENDNFEELETTLNKTKSYVSVTAGHFSKYMVVDRQAWFDNWREISLAFESMPLSPVITSICVDCSGSMSSNDPTFLTGTGIEQEPVNYRILAVRNFINAMMPLDMTGLITYENSATVLSGLTSDKTALKNSIHFYNGGGTNADSAVTKALNQLNGNVTSTNKNIILMSDGDVNISQINLDNAIENQIKIHTIGLGSGASNATLKSYAEQTGGEFFKATTAENLEEIYDSLSIGNQFDFDTMADSDGDGVPDDIEISGIPMSNGMIFFTDPDKTDTDGDGLNDSEEVIPVIERRRYYPAGTPDEAVSYKYYFEFRSDPTKVDTDGDGFSDNVDVDPMYYDDINGLIYQSEHKIGIGYTVGEIADDLKTNDYTYDEMMSISNSFKYQLDSSELYLKEDFLGLLDFFAITNDGNNVVKELINVFMNGTSDFVNVRTNDGIIAVPSYTSLDLKEMVYNDDQVQNYIKYVKNEFSNQIKINNGDFIQTKRSMQNIIEDSNSSNIAFSKKHLSYLLGGMTLSVNDLWGSSIDIIDFKCDGNTYAGTLHFRLYDHFGLDQPDVEKIYVKLAGFRAWYVLQHYDKFDGKYQPFINVFDYYIVISGEL